MGTGTERQRFLGNGSKNVRGKKSLSSYRVIDTRRTSQRGKAIRARHEIVAKNFPNCKPPRAYSFFS